VDFLIRFAKNLHVTNFMKMRLVGSELYAERQTDGRRHDEANSGLFAILLTCPKRNIRPRRYELNFKKSFNLLCFN
jgi:hypothetical protein